MKLKFYETKHTLQWTNTIHNYNIFVPKHP